MCLLFISIWPNSIALSIHPSIYLFIHLFIYLSIRVSIYLSIYTTIYLFKHLCIHLSIYLVIYPSVYLSIYLCRSKLDILVLMDSLTKLIQKSLLAKLGRLYICLAIFHSFYLFYIFFLCRYPYLWFSSSFDLARYLFLAFL